MNGRPAAPNPWSEATLALALFAVDPEGTGLRLRGRAGPARDALLELLAELLPDAPIRRLPVGVDETRLIGGLDLGATLASGRPVLQTGLLAEADGGVVVAAMAERIDRGAAALLEAALDTGRSSEAPARFGVVALDEGIGPDEPLLPSLADRLALVVDLDAVTLADLAEAHEACDPTAVRRARSLNRSVKMSDQAIPALVEIAESFGIASIRAVSAALRVARAAAALDGRRAMEDRDLATAARLVLLPRATTLPAPAPETEPPPSDPPPEQAEASPDEPPPTEPEDSSSEPETETDEDRTDAGSLAETVIEAVRAALPPEVFAAIVDRSAAAAKSGARGRGNLPATGRRGRPAGITSGRAARGERLALLATLRAAIPQQPFRKAVPGGPAIRLRPDDFRHVRRRIRRRIATVFVVDASGSAALHRLGEAKGAVELMLAECYVRRDEVALIAFRGPGAETILPPTRSLARAKRALGALPGGGGTPLASGLDEARRIAEAVKKKGDTPVVVLLTDGQANIARSGAGGRAEASADALAAAQAFRLAGCDAVLIDTSPRPQPKAREIAEAMGARYVALPQADAARMARAASAAAKAARG